MQGERKWTLVEYCSTSCMIGRLVLHGLHVGLCSRISTTPEGQVELLLGRDMGLLLEDQVAEQGAYECAKY